MRRTLFAVATLLIGAGAAAQDSPIPRLGDHTFVPATSIIEPFITTIVQTTISLGQTANATVPVIDFDNPELISRVDADLMLAGIGFHYQQGVKDWLAVGLTASVAGRLGTSTTTLVSEGITASLGYNLSWKMRAYRSAKVIVSGHVALGSQGATFINLFDWAQGIIDGTNVPLVRPRQSLRGTGGVLAGWGISRRFGLLGSLEGTYGESFDGKGVNDVNYDARLALSYDLGYDLKIPLGLVLTGGRFESDDIVGSRTGLWFWSARLAAQGRKDFSIGLDFQNTYYKSGESDATIQINQVAIDMRYYY